MTSIRPCKTRSLHAEGWIRAPIPLVLYSVRLRRTRAILHQCCRLKSKFLIATLFEAMYCLQLHGFETKVLVCDGASPNLAAIKLLTGFGNGAFGSKPAGSCGDVHEVKAWFINLFTKEKVFTLICPSHQVRCRATCTKVGIRSKNAYTGKDNSTINTYTAHLRHVNELIERVTPFAHSSCGCRD